MDRLTIETRVIEFLRTVTGLDSFTAETDLFDAGVTDSRTMMDLLVFVETEFLVRLGFTDLTPDVFKTPQSLADLIAQRLASAQQSMAA
jgi:acyl carrier protein